MEQFIFVMVCLGMAVSVLPFAARGSIACIVSMSITLTIAVLIVLSNIVYRIIKRMKG